MRLVCVERTRVSERRETWGQAKLTKNTDLHCGMRLIPVEQDKYDRGQRNCILKYELQMTCGPWTGGYSQINIKTALPL